MFFCAFCAHEEKKIKKEKSPYNVNVVNTDVHNSVRVSTPILT